MTERPKWAGGSPPPEQDRPAGWGRTAIMSHVHYFIRTRSLCGKWTYTGPTSPEPVGSDRDRLCAICDARLYKLRELKAATP